MPSLFWHCDLKVHLYKEVWLPFDPAMASGGRWYSLLIWMEFVRIIAGNGWDGDGIGKDVGCDFCRRRSVNKRIGMHFLSVIGF
ncbi:hypothetical protein Zmor_013196 [Zophobas morio]|uniref:Uncharacterized protein n=1 Tax=Zophobas morio TaxID=2755281 RepID=A0AA38MF49_9CUCU|nr:hypothetical protein Zmor_013196 [Zophobas morio]